MTFLGIDLGTSGLRALLVDAEGSPLAEAERDYPTQHPHPGWSEQDPGDWILALESAIEQLRATHARFSELAGIAVSGHMHGAVTLDARNNVIRPCIMWNDTRSAHEAARLDAMPGVRELSGNIVFPGFTAPKLEWMRRHEPKHHARVARALLPAGYLNWYLTGDFVADMSDSSGTSWLDVKRRDWSDTLLECGQMSREQMPRLVEGSAPAGELRADLARAWGLSGPVVVAGGAGDNAAAACGIGALSEGQGFISLGSSGVLLMARDGYRPAPETSLHTFCHAVPDRWYQMGVMLSATSALNWLAGITGKHPSQLAGALGDGLEPPGPERFLPYLSGERTPHNDPDIRGALTGIGMQSSVTALTRAVMQGVAFGLRDCAEAIKSTGAEFSTCYAIGGGAASVYWVRLLATVLDTPLLLPEKGELGAAMGAARLATIAATGAEIAEVIRPPKTAAEITPDPRLHSEFEDAYQQFRESYAAIKAVQ